MKNINKIILGSAIAFGIGLISSPVISEFLNPSTRTYTNHEGKRYELRQYANGESYLLEYLWPFAGWLEDTNGDGEADISAKPIVFPMGPRLFGWIDRKEPTEEQRELYRNVVTPDKDARRFLDNSGGRK